MLSDYDKVYGQSFKKFSQLDQDSLTVNLEKRFKENKIDPKKLFKNKKCLDVGCGYGAGSLFLAKNGAKSVSSVDISKINVETTTLNSKRFNYEKIIKVQQSSALKLPFKDQSFDIVWCFGVLHITSDPDKGLRELTRVLTTNGKLLMFLYGAGGILWYTIFRGRKYVKKIGTSSLRQIIEFCENDHGMITSIMDNWKTPFLCNYKNDEVLKRVKELGFIESEPLKYGLKWDLNHRISKFKNERNFCGGGDLRYILTKKIHFPFYKKSQNSLHNNEICPQNKLDSYFIKEYGDYIDRFERKCKKDTTLGILCHRMLFNKVAELHRSEQPFEYKKLIKFVKDIL